MQERASSIIAVGKRKRQVVRFVRTYVGTFRVVSASVYCDLRAAKAAATRWEKPWMDHMFGKR